MSGDVINPIRKYFSFFRIRFSAGLQYRAAALAGVVTQFIWGTMEILLYEAFWRTDPTSFPMERGSLYTYIWLQQALLAMYMPWIFDNSIFDQITNGGVALELCRPADIYMMWYVKNCSMRLSQVLLRCIPIFVITAFLPAPFGFRLPNDPIRLLLSLVSLIVGFLLMISISMLIYISAFYTLDSRGVRMAAATIAEFCAGAVIPLPFLPDGIRRVVDLLPFASTQSTPFLIFSGALTGPDALWAMLLQLFWCAALIAVVKLWMRSALKKVVLQGG